MKWSLFWPVAMVWLCMVLFALLGIVWHPCNRRLSVMGKLALSAAVVNVWLLLVAAVVVFGIVTL